jgi:hypothetical protein
MEDTGTTRRSSRRSRRRGRRRRKEELRGEREWIITTNNFQSSLIEKREK